MIYFVNNFIYKNFKKTIFFIWNNKIKVIYIHFMMSLLCKF